MNLTAAQTELQARGAPESSTTRLNLWLNDAKNDFEDFWDWPWLEAVTSGAAPLTISDLKAILYVVDTTNQRPLLGVKPEWLIQQESYDLTRTGVPEYWYLDGLTSLKVYPVATPSLSVRYLKYSPELSSGTDTPLIPERYHHIWVDLAMIRAYRDSDAHQEAQVLEQRCQQRLGQLVLQYEARNRQNPDIQQSFSSTDW